MKRIISYTTVLIITIIALTACTGQETSKTKAKAPVTNKYMDQRNGGYMVLLEGQPVESPVEMFVLHKNGKANWKLVEVYAGGKTKIVSDKYGTWSATLNSIIIDINGNTGLINETFNLSSGKFKNGQRYLKKTE